MNQPDICIDTEMSIKGKGMLERIDEDKSKAKMGS